MKVPAHLILPGRQMFERLMAKNHSRKQFQFRMQDDAVSRIEMITEDVMITGYQFEAAGWKSADHCTKDIPFRIVMAVKQVTDNDHSFRPVLHQEPDNGLRIRIVGPGGNRYPGFPEMVDFAQVKV